MWRAVEVDRASDAHPGGGKRPRNNAHDVELRPNILISVLLLTHNGEEKAEGEEDGDHGEEEEGEAAKVTGSAEIHHHEREEEGEEKEGIEVIGEREGDFACFSSAPDEKGGSKD